VDTAGMLFICGGAFAGLDKVIRDRSEKTSIGFAAKVVSQTEDKSTSEILKSVETEDLVKYGLIPEFVGRLPVIATLSELDEDALIEILTQPKNALTKQYQQLFEIEDVELDFREDALRAVARKAMERKSGARGLRSIMEGILLDIMYEIPSEPDVCKVVIDESVVNGDSAPIKIYGNQETARAVPETDSGAAGSPGALRLYHCDKKGLNTGPFCMG